MWVYLLTCMFVEKYHICGKRWGAHYMWVCIIRGYLRQFGELQGNGGKLLNAAVVLEYPNNHQGREIPTAYLFAFSGHFVLQSISVLVNLEVNFGHHFLFRKNRMWFSECDHWYPEIHKGKTIARKGMKMKSRVFTSWKRKKNSHWLRKQGVFFFGDGACFRCREEKAKGSRMICAAGCFDTVAPSENLWTDTNLLEWLKTQMSSPVFLLVSEIKHSNTYKNALEKWRLLSTHPITACWAKLGQMWNSSVHQVCWGRGSLVFAIQHTKLQWSVWTPRRPYGWQREGGLDCWISQGAVNKWWGFLRFPSAVLSS